MKRKDKNRIIRMVVTGVFLMKLYLGFNPAAEPGMGPGGAAPEPMAVVCSAGLAALMALALLEGLFRLWSKAGKK